MSQYYQYYDGRGRSVYAETVTLAGVAQAQALPRGAVELNHDDYQHALTTIDEAAKAAEREADRIGRSWTPPEPPPVGGEDEGE